MSTEPSREPRSVISHVKLLNTEVGSRRRRASLTFAIAFGLTFDVAGQAGATPVSVRITQLKEILYKEL